MHFSISTDVWILLQQALMTTVCQNNGLQDNIPFYDVDICDLGGHARQSQVQKFDGVLTKLGSSWWKYVDVCLLVISLKALSMPLNSSQMVIRLLSVVFIVHINVWHFVWKIVSHIEEEARSPFVHLYNSKRSSKKMSWTSFSVSSASITIMHIAIVLKDFAEASRAH